MGLVGGLRHVYQSFHSVLRATSFDEPMFPPLVWMRWGCIGNAMRCMRIVMAQTRSHLPGSETYHYSSPSTTSYFFPRIPHSPQLAFTATRVSHSAISHL